MDGHVPRPWTVIISAVDGHTVSSLSMSYLSLSKYVDRVEPMSTQPEFRLADWVIRPDWLKNTPLPRDEKQASNVVSLEQYRREREKQNNRAR